MKFIIILILILQVIRVEYQNKKHLIFENYLSTSIGCIAQDVFVEDGKKVISGKGKDSRGNWTRGYCHEELEWNEKYKRYNLINFLKGN